MKIAERGYGTLHLGGEDRPFLIGTYQAKTFCTMRGIELGAYFEELSKFKFENGLDNDQFLCELVYSALVAGGVLYDAPVDYSLDKLTVWLDTAAPDEIAKFFFVWMKLDQEAPKK